MARPNKLRLDYFPLDVDIFDDEKVSAISAEFGYKAEIIIIKLLCSIYRNGYYYEWDDVHRGFFMSKLRGVSESLLDNVIKRLVTYDFFDKQLSSWIWAHYIGYVRYTKANICNLQSHAANWLYITYVRLRQNSLRI